jgi:hypothetical protein
MASLKLTIGAIQIIRDTRGWGEVRDSVTKYHKGEGGGRSKCHMTFFGNFFFIYFDIFALKDAFKLSVLNN